MDVSLENVDSGDEAPENLNVDAPAFVPGSPGISSGSGLDSPGGSTSDSSNLYSPIAHQNAEDSMRRGLHVDVPNASNDVLKILDHVPFTPSQGVRTPSPKNKAALRTKEWTDSGPSRFARSPRAAQPQPSPPFSPRPTNRALQFEQPMMAFPNMYSTQQQPGGNDYGGMPIPQAANEQMAPGQMMHQMVFGFSGSPPASPTSSASYMQFTTMHMGMPPQGSPPQVPPQAPPHMQMYGQMYPAAGNQMPNLMALSMGQHNPMIQPEYQIQQPFNAMHPVVGGAQPGPMSLMAGDPMMSGIQIPPPPQMPMRGMRANNSRFLSTNNPYQGGPNTYQNHSSSTHNQAGRMLGRNPSMPDGRKGVGSGKSSANSSATGSPMARDNANPQTLEEYPGMKSRMNARQRRTLRRRREREISSVADHVAELGDSLDSNEKSAFDLQMEEVQSIMLAIHNGQHRDTGDGGVVDIQIQRLFEIAKLPMPAPAAAEGTENAASSNLVDGEVGNEAGADEGEHCNQVIFKAVSPELDVVFDKQMVLDYPTKDSDAKQAHESTDRSDCSPLQPSTPDQQTA